MLGCLIVAAASVEGAETGSISGVVFDQGGQVVAGAAVTVKGEGLPAGRVVTTEADGQYRLTLLIPGNYTLTVEKAVVGVTTRTVRVEVDKDTQLDVLLGMAVQEDVPVTAAMPDVDLTSTEVSFNDGRELIASPALSHLRRVVPAGARRGRQPELRAQRWRQPAGQHLPDRRRQHHQSRFGYLSTEVNELDIVEFNVKRGATPQRVRPIVGLGDKRGDAVGQQPVRGRRVLRDDPGAVIGDGAPDRVRASRGRIIAALTPRGRR